MVAQQKKQMKNTNEMKSYYFDFLNITDILNYIGESFNLPKFCPSATWNPNATTFVDIFMIGTFPQVVFLDKNNISEHFFFLIFLLTIV